MIRKAFTLIELLVVISIIAVLMSILMPAMTKAREQAKKIMCASNISQQHIGTMTYTESAGGKLPPTALRYEQKKEMIAGVVTRHFKSIITSGGELEWFNMGFVWNANTLKTGEVFYCPSQKFEAFLYESYADPVFPSENPRFPGAIRVAYHFNPVATTSTIGGAKYWMHKYTRTDELTSKAVMYVDNLRADAIGHLSSSGFNVGFGDGSARFISDRSIMEDMSRKAGSPEFDANWPDRNQWDDIMKRISEQ